MLCSWIAALAWMHSSSHSVCEMQLYWMLETIWSRLTELLRLSDVKYTVIPQMAKISPVTHSGDCQQSSDCSLGHSEGQVKCFLTLSIFSQATRFQWDWEPDWKRCEKSQLSITDCLWLAVSPLSRPPRAAATRGCLGRRQYAAWGSSHRKDQKESSSSLPPSALLWAKGQILFPQWLSRGEEPMIIPPSERASLEEKHEESYSPHDLQHR